MNAHDKINTILHQVDYDLKEALNKSFSKVTSQTNLSSLEFNYNSDMKFSQIFKDDISLTEYLFLKMKIYVLHHLLSDILFLHDIDTENFTKHKIDGIAPTLFYLNNVDIEKESFDKDGKKLSYSKILEKKNLTGLNKEINRKFNFIDYKFENEFVLKGIERSTPYYYFKEMIEQEFDFDFFFKNIPFLYKSDQYLAEKYISNFPKNFSEYMTLTVTLMFQNEDEITSSNNIIKRSNTILSKLNQDDLYNDYSAINELIYTYNSDLEKINLVYEHMPKNETKYYAFFFLINSYYHNNFFSSLSHPLLDTILRRISFEELYINSKNEKAWFEKNEENIISNDFKAIITNYTLKESMYYLNLLSLLMEFDFNFNDLCNIDFYKIKTHPEILYNKKQDKYKMMEVYNSNKYDILKEQESIFESTLHLIYDFLAECRNLVPEILKNCNDQLEQLNREFMNNDLNIDVIDYACHDITNIIANIYSKKDFSQFKKITINSNIVHKNYFLLAYLFKSSFIKG